MAEAWFETVAIAQQRAKRRLPKSVYSSLIAASEKGITVADNVAAFSELGFAPHVIGATDKRDLSTTVMGQEVSLPVIISPTGVQAVDPGGEVAVARAAAARGTVMGLSSFASKPIEEVIAANPKTFFQVYWQGGRDDIDLFELNEAFASVVLKFQKDLNIPDEKLNVNGGAIAMGHPLGATGAMILGTMVDELERRNARRALITLCIGGGMGVATIIERV